MEPSELPPFPNPEPSAPPPQPAGRGGTMLLQALFLLAFWSVVYLMHEQATSIVAAREREEAERAELKRAGVGKWESTHGDGTVLELKGEPSRYAYPRGRFTFSRNGEVVVRGEFEYDWSESHYRLENTSYWSGSGTFFRCRYRAQDDELELYLGERHVWQGYAAVDLG